ncbi:MAG: metallophosphoesterase [Ferruginibacter sp.]|nr:metallophosphoesterase [Cytophagales bacterium]
MSYRPLIAIFLLLSAARTSAALPSDTSRVVPGFTVFLIGDAGSPVPDGKDPNLNLLRNQLRAAGKNSAVVFLGDNLYPKGLPDAAAPGRREAERHLTGQLDILADYPGRVVFIPGNHDWQRSGRKGWQHVQNQEKFVEATLNRGNVFLPDGGCPGPVEVSLSEMVTLVVLDTQWFLHPWDKPGEESDCEAKDPAALIVQLDDILARNRHKQVIVVAHHPMYTYGPHGGYSTWKQHLFPLTDLHPSLYLPLPVIGSVYPLYRKLLGDPQDLAHPRNRLMRKALIETLRRYPGLVYADGHEHSLEYIETDSLHYVVSGSGSKRTPVKQGKYARFVSDHQGFARLDYGQAGGQVALSFWEPTGLPDGKQVYATQWTTKLVSLPASPDRNAATLSSPSPPYVTVRASGQYGAGKLTTLLLGGNYRREWQQPVRVPVFDIDREMGGLKPVKRGGGFQTKSLRLEGADGQEYVLRSVEKDAEGAIPVALRRTLAADIVQDQISAAHPYAALTVPILAEAAGVAHTNPKLVFIADDPRLGEYRSAFANTLALFEERDAPPPAHFGGTPTTKGGVAESYSTPKVLEKLRDDNDHRVDGREVLRARLLDMVLADWDRHDDQWRWLAYEREGGLLFRPLPRDRDQAYFVNQGVLPFVASREWALPKIQGFDYGFQNVNSFMFNGRYFDRSFLTEPSGADWRAVADSVKASLTDEVIEKAIRQWPDSIFRLSGPAVIAKLKAHRDRLPADAETYYRFLAREVEVLGSDKQEFFEVVRQDGGRTRVTVYKINKRGQKEGVLYRRTFNASETREIRLFGHGGDDEFEVSGQVEAGTRVRIIGGEGEDRIADRSGVRGASRQTVVYDTRQGNDLALGGEARDRTSRDPAVHQHDRRSFQYPYAGPLVPFNFNPDDGLFLGAGVLFRRPGFRKQPYAASHRITANVALATGAYNFDYQGTFTEAVGKLDLQLDADVQAPNFVRNFFGLGNESAFNQEVNINYYRVRFRNIVLSGLLRRRAGPHQAFFFGPTFQTVEVEESEGRYINQVTDLPDRATLFSNKLYAGGRLGFDFDNRDHKLFTTRGTHWHTELIALRGITGAARNLTQIQSALAFYWTFRLPARVTLATRLGGTANLGGYEFFQAGTLGGLSNLRGFRRTRFAGRSSFYHNAELRLKLFSFRTYLFPASVGIVGFHDVGRVWLDGEDSKVWHNGYGGGLWLAPFQQLVVSASYGISREEKLPLIKLGFFF